jgi:hypothetical protein
MTLYEAAASERAIPSPIPCAAPVTSAIVRSIGSTERSIPFLDSRRTVSDCASSNRTDYFEMLITEIGAAMMNSSIHVVNHPAILPLQTRAVSCNFTIFTSTALTRLRFRVRWAQRSISANSHANVIEIPKTSMIE